MKHPLKRNSDKGFSLVEIMVGMVIGMLGIIVIYQVFAVFEGQKRTTTSGGDAQQNGALGLYTIERDVRMAGYGINDPAILGCTIQAYNINSAAPGTFTLTLVPISITKNPANTPDSITVFYSNASTLMSPAKLQQTMPSPAADFKVDNRYGFNAGDLVIAASPGTSPSLDCTLFEITGIPGTAGQTDVLNHNTGNYINAQGANVPATYNKAGGLGISYPMFDYSTNKGGKLYNIGAGPINNTYSVQNSQLMLQSGTLGIAGAATAIADGIVQLKAYYGKDTTGDQEIDDFDDITPTDAAGWAQILAVRMAIVARSGQREKPNATTGQCDTTTTFPTWSGKTLVPGSEALDLSANPDWKCYRYKTFETSVPLRNMIWRQ